MACGGVLPLGNDLASLVRDPSPTTPDLLPQGHSRNGPQRTAKLPQLRRCKGAQRD